MNSAEVTSVNNPPSLPAPALPACYLFLLTALHTCHHHHHHCTHFLSSQTDRTACKTLSTDISIGQSVRAQGGWVLVGGWWWVGDYYYSPCILVCIVFITLYLLTFPFLLLTALTCTFALYLNLMYSSSSPSPSPSPFYVLVDS